MWVMVLGGLASGPKVTVPMPSDPFGSPRRTTSTIRTTPTTDKKMGTGGGLVVIDFSEQGNSAYFRVDGWSGQEPDRVWAIGPCSIVRIPLQSSGRPIMLEVEAAPCDAPPVITGQIVRVQVNGTVIGGVRLESRALIRCEIAPELARPDGVLEVEFKCPGFYVPMLSGINDEMRPLSCWFTFIRAYTTDMFSPGPHFPASRPDIPVIALSPPFVETPLANSKESPMVYTFGLPGAPVPAPEDEPDVGENDFTVTERSSGQLKLLAPRTPGAYVLRLDASPLIAFGQPKQDVTILLDNTVIGQLSVEQAAAWIVPLPRELTERRDILRLNFMLPAARRDADVDPSSDTAPVGIAVTRVSILPLPSYLLPAESLRAEQAGQPRPIATSAQYGTDDARTLPASVIEGLGMDLVSLVRGFESLGTNPEFGVVQRKLGLDVVNLFRYCEATLDGLTQALTDDLNAAADPARFTQDWHDAAPRLTLLPYNLRWRTFGPTHDAAPDASGRAGAITIGYLRRKFYEGLRAGRKIYVLKQGTPVPTDQAAVLLMELNRSGSATLLCVEEVAAGRQPGEVDLLTPGLMRGYVGRFAPDTNVESADPTDWLRVLANAVLLKRRPNATAAC